MILVVVVADDPQNFDEAEGGSQATQGRLLVGVDLGHGPSWLAPRWLVTSGTQVQVDPAALELEFVVISSRVEARPVDQQRCVADAVFDAAGAGRVADRS